MNDRLLTTVLVKPAGPDCNMLCRYCFYCGKAGLFGAGAPLRMSAPVLEETIRQACTAGSRQLTMAWQGGEPTLMGLDFFRRAVLLQRQHARSDQRILNSLQTNGLLLDRGWTSFLHETGTLVGLSLDGPRDLHDHYRRTIGGGGTWKRVVDGLQMLRDEGVEVNALSVVTDRAAERAAEIYRFHKELGLRHMQFIPCVQETPGGSDHLPPASIRPEQYGRFLCDLFDCWCDDFRQDEPTTAVRWLEAVLATYLGTASFECTLRSECGDYLLVEHNGDVFPCDFFVESAWLLGNVLTDDLGQLLNSARQRSFGRLKEPKAPQCHSCPWLTHCQGGCPRERLAVDVNGIGLSCLCEAYRIFFDHSDRRLRSLAADWLARQRRLASAHLPRPLPAGGKPGRNDPCPCGSGHKYKRCCGVGQ